MGQEGLAHLTAASMLEAGAGERTGKQLADALYPTGNEIELARTDGPDDLHERLDADAQGRQPGIDRQVGRRAEPQSESSDRAQVTAAAGRARGCRQQQKT